MADGRAWWRRPRWRSLVLLAVVSLTLGALAVIVEVITDDLWFKEVGQEDVYQRILVVKALLFLVAGTVTALVLGLSLAVARLLVPTPLPKTTVVGGVVACALAGAVEGARAAHEWQALLLWMNGGRFGVRDPIHHRDIGFFVFSLPFYERVAGFLSLLTLASAVMAIVIHHLGGAIETHPLRVSRPARVHLSVIAAVALLLRAWHWHLDTFTLEEQPRRAAFPGPHYTDVHVRLPGLELLSKLALLGTVALLVSAFLSYQGRDRAARWTTIATIATLALVTLVGQRAAPWIVQRLEVSPHGLVNERPYLEQAIRATRRGFGLTRVQIHAFNPTTTDATPALERPGLLVNSQLWNTGALKLWMQQVDTLSPFYRPRAPSLDAPRIAGRRRLVAVSERELDVDAVGGSGHQWINNRLAYTHGYGAVRVSGTLTDGGGRPVRMDKAPVLSQPRVYFGRQLGGAATWVVANTRRPEVDLPRSADTRASPYRYTGDGGIELSGPLRRLAFGVRLRSLALLIGRDTTVRSRLILHRDILDRLRTLAPFLVWDRHPSVEVAGGRIMFLADGYTTSDGYPGAAASAVAGTRSTYARAAVRASIDAFSGRTQLYLADDADPIVRAWTSAFPTLLKPMSAMPAWVRGRLRYPRDLFDAQARLYERFHIGNAGAFSSQADAWTPPTGLSGSVSVAGQVRFDDDDNSNRVQAGYRLAAAPGQHTPRLLRSMLYSPRHAENLVATLDGWIDNRGRPRLAARSLPRDRLTLGPAQMTRQILLAPNVVDRLGLLNRETADLNRSSIEATALGLPRVVFLEHRVLQVQAVYINAEGEGIMRMLGVTVFVDGHVGIGRTADAALHDALRPRPAISVTRIARPLVVGRPTVIAFRVSHGQRENVRVSSSHGVEMTRDFLLTGGRGALQWTPQRAGTARIRVAVHGPDGNRALALVPVKVRPAPKPKKKPKPKPKAKHPKKKQAHRSPSKTTPSTTAPGTEAPAPTPTPTPTVTVPVPVPAPPVTVTTPAPAPPPVTVTVPRGK